MDDRLYRLLKLTAIVLTVAFVGWAVYEKFVAAPEPGDMAYHAANNLFEDGFYERAAAAYQEALDEDPGHIHALRGLARSLHMSGAHEQALLLYDEAIATEPGFAATYANRGILLDTIGQHEEALADYERALQLDEEIADGPNWLTRFLRNQAEAPPTIADRARYLRAELAKPDGERVLRDPELDAAQRPYQQ
jgi:tetratricopeptide (TPR) repeat protein